MSLMTKIFGTYSQRQLKKVNAIANQVDALAEKYKSMTNAELQAVTPALKARLQAGETLDEILPDAFAAVREADERADGIIRRAENEAELERRRASEDMKHEIVELSTALAEKMLGREVKQEDHRAMIADVIDQIGDGNEADRT